MNIKIYFLLLVFFIGIGNFEIYSQISDKIKNIDIEKAKTPQGGLELAQESLNTILDPKGLLLDEAEYQLDRLTDLVISNLPSLTGQASTGTNIFSLSKKVGKQTQKTYKMHEGQKAILQEINNMQEARKSEFNKLNGLNENGEISDYRINRIVLTKNKLMELHRKIGFASMNQSLKEIEGLGYVSDVLKQDDYNVFLMNYTNMWASATNELMEMYETIKKKQVFYSDFEFIQKIDNINKFIGSIDNAVDALTALRIEVINKQRNRVRYSSK